MRVHLDATREVRNGKGGAFLSRGGSVANPDSEYFRSRLSLMSFVFTSHISQNRSPCSHALNQLCTDHEPCLVVDSSSGRHRTIAQGSRQIIVPPGCNIPPNTRAYTLAAPSCFRGRGLISQSDHVYQDREIGS